MKGIALDPGLRGSHKDMYQSRLKKACAEFESIFMSYVLKSMRKTIVEDGLLGNTNESKIFKSMFDEKVALEIASGGGIGLGEMLFERLKNEKLPPRIQERGNRGAGIWG